MTESELRLLLALADAVARLSSVTVAHAINDAVRAVRAEAAEPARG